MISADDWGVRMVLWWIGNIVLIAVVIPAVLFFLNLVLRQILEVKSYADDILDHGVALTATVDCVPQLIETVQLAHDARLNVTQYGLALAMMVEAEAEAAGLRR